MRDNIEMSKKVYYLIIILCAMIIMSNSMETFIKAKDNGLFDLWLSNPNLNIDRNELNNQELYSVYLNMCLALFFIKVITPMALAINSYFSFVKLRVNKLFIQIWMVLIIGLFAFTSLGETFYSIFFVINLLSYLFLVVILIHLWKEINKKKLRAVF